MQIAQYQFPNPVVLAPMAGVTDLVFRRICKEMGCALSVTEMISDKGLIYSQRATMKIAEIAEPGFVSVQLFGSEVEPMIQAVERINEIHPHLIDINMGCPALKIVKNGEGSAMMLKPELASEIMAAVVRHSIVPVTVKMRLGWDAKNINCLEIAKRAEAAGVSAITLHARTREQFYGGKADWQYIKRLKETLTIPVIGNGDIWLPEDAARMQSLTGADGVMIGRGILGNPWLIRNTVALLTNGQVFSTPNYRDKIQMAIRHLHELVAYKGEHTGVREMRKHGAWYLKSLRGASGIRILLNSAKTVDEMEGILLGYQRELARLPEDQILESS